MTTLVAIILLIVYGAGLFCLSMHTICDCFKEEDKPFYRKNSSAGMRRLRLVLWPIAMFLP